MQNISTSVSANNVLKGSILLNLQGEIVGVKINGNADSPTSFMPANAVSDFLASQNSA